MKSHGRDYVNNCLVGCDAV